MAKNKWNEDYDEFRSRCSEIMPLEIVNPHRTDYCDLCWKMNEIIPQQKVILRNSKYCWLYPHAFSRAYKKIEPNFEECTTLYTKCDRLLEQCTHEILLKLEQQFRSYYILFKEQINLQIKLIDEMWIDSQRYLILTEGGVCIKLYPEIISRCTESRALRNFNCLHELVDKSNCLLSTTLEGLRATFSELDKKSVQLDFTVDSPFIKGTWYMKSFGYIRKLLNDLFIFFYQVLCKIKSWAELLQITDSVAIEDYMNLIKVSPKYDDNLMEYFNNCFCLRTKRKECIQTHQSC